MTRIFRVHDRGGAFGRCWISLSIYVVLCAKNQKSDSNENVTRDFLCMEVKKATCNHPHRSRCFLATNSLQCH